MRNHEPTSLIRHLQVLRAVSEAVSRSLDLDEVVQRSLAALTNVTGHEIASLHLISADGNGPSLELIAPSDHRIDGAYSERHSAPAFWMDEGISWDSMHGVIAFWVKPSFNPVAFK